MKSLEKFPSAKEILEEAKKMRADDINDLHSTTYDLMLNYKQRYYQKKVSQFLKNTSLKGKQLREVKQKMLTPIEAAGVTYSNFMEEASRRISQIFQVISGNIAELCIENFLIETGLEEGIHFTRKQKHTDFIFYYPNRTKPEKEHRLEVKNVKLRERGTRGLAFDGDSMAGFFDDSSEFTQDNIAVIEAHCLKTGGYCYLPPQTLEKIKHRINRFRNNTILAGDMKHFVQTGSLP